MDDFSASKVYDGMSDLAFSQLVWQPGWLSNKLTEHDEDWREREKSWKQTNKKKHVHLINCLRNPCLKTRLIYLIKFNCMSSSLTRQTWMRLRDGFLLRQVPLHQWKLPLLANSQCCRCAFLVGHLRNQVLWYGDLHQTAEQWSEERLC